MAIISILWGNKEGPICGGGDEGVTGGQGEEEEGEVGRGGEEAGSPERRRD